MVQGTFYFSSCLQCAVWVLVLVLELSLLSKRAFCREIKKASATTSSSQASVMMPEQEIAQFYDFLSHPGCEHHTSQALAHEYIRTQRNVLLLNPSLHLPVPTCKHSEGDDAAKERFQQKKPPEMRSTCFFSGKNIQFSLLENEGVGNQLVKVICHGTVTCTGCSGELLSPPKREGCCGYLVEGFVEEQILVREMTGAFPESSSGRGKFVECRITLSWFPRRLGAR